MERNRSWCFTINNYLHEDLQAIDTMCEERDVKYCVYGEEQGAEGTPHIQGYVQFAAARTMSAVSADLPRAHLEIAKGSAQSNRDYCSKEDQAPFEYGLMPLTPKERGAVRRGLTSEDYAFMLLCAQTGRRRNGEGSMGTHQVSC